MLKRPVTFALAAAFVLALSLRSSSVAYSYCRYCKHIFAGSWFCAFSGSNHPNGSCACNSDNGALCDDSTQTCNGAVAGDPCSSAAPLCGPGCNAASHNAALIFGNSLDGSTNQRNSTLPQVCSDPSSSGSLTVPLWLEGSAGK